MKDNVLIITYNLNFIIKKLEKMVCDETNAEVNEKLKIINEKVYEISDVVEAIEVMLE